MDAAARWRSRGSAWLEDSPSPVYGAALLMRLGGDPFRSSHLRSSAPHQALRSAGEVPSASLGVISPPVLAHCWHGTAVLSRVVLVVAGLGPVSFLLLPG